MGFVSPWITVFLNKLQNGRTLAFSPLIAVNTWIFWIPPQKFPTLFSETFIYRSLDDFVEDLVAENSRLKAKVADSERSVETKEYKILDLELNVNGLRETLRDIQVKRNMSHVTSR